MMTIPTTDKFSVIKVSFTLFTVYVIFYQLSTGWKAMVKKMKGGNQEMVD